MDYNGIMIELRLRALILLAKDLFWYWGISSDVSKRKKAKSDSRIPSLRKNDNSFKTFTLCIVNIVQWHSIYGTVKSRVHTNTYTLQNSICTICYVTFKTNNSTDQRLTQPGPCIIPWGSDGASTVSSRAPKFTQHGLLLRYNVLRNTPTSPNVSAAELWKSNSQYWMLWEIGVSCFDDWTQFRLSTDLNLFNQKGEAHDSINRDPALK